MNILKKWASVIRNDRNDRYRSERICKELTRKYGLYFANGKEHVKTHRLKEPDKSRYEIYQILKVARCSDWNTLLKRLKAEGIDVRFKYKGNTNEIQGIVFKVSKSQRAEQTVNADVDLTPIKELIQNGNRENKEYYKPSPPSLQEQSSMNCPRYINGWMPLTGRNCPILKV